MRVLVIGANGFIGSAVAARLLASGHAVTGIVRRPGSAATGTWTETVLDVATAGPETWARAVADMDAVVNCAGTLQDGPADSVKAVHAGAVGALVKACEAAGVRRLVHLSAIGVDRETPSPFSRSKRAGDDAVAASRLDWVILRPAVVTGRAAYGGSALFRGLAALPVLPVLPGTAPLQVVQLEEVVDTVAILLEPGAPCRVALDLAGPEALSLEDVVRTYRAWLGYQDARSWRVPGWLAALAYRAGDVAGALGWRPPVRTTARREMVRGATGDPGPWTRATGLAPASLAAALRTSPASVQEHWFAPLYALKPLLFVVFALFWIGTGLVSVGPGYEMGRSLMEEGGAGRLSGPSVIAGGLADLAIGLGILVRRTTRTALWAAVALSLFYAAAGTAIMPRLWADPLGPMLKIWPILGLNLVLLAIHGDR